MNDTTELHGSQDKYEQRGGESFRRCSYCGSVHPQDLLKARNEGKIGSVDRSVDWKYGWPHKIYVDVDGSFAKFYNVHTLEPFLSKEEQIKLFEFVGYSFWFAEKGGIKFSKWNYTTEIPRPRELEKYAAVNPQTLASYGKSYIEAEMGLPVRESALVPIGQVFEMNEPAIMDFDFSGVLCSSTQE